MQIDMISLDAAAREQWDVVIAGTSFAAMLFAHGLPAGRKILFIEKGARHTHDEWLSGKVEAGDVIAQENQTDRPKPWVTSAIFGGNSNCWWGQVPRFHPSDFRLFSLYGVGQDWPISYDILEPFYAEVETVMEISGGGSDGHLPRSRPFPFPPHAPSRTDVALRAWRPDVWHAAPTARSNGGSRATCCANGICSTCPIDAKFTILNGLGRLAPNVRAAVVLNTEVRAVDIAAGTARGVWVRGQGGIEALIPADLVALAANAISNPAILLRSGHEAYALGRYLHEQDSIDLMLDVEHPNFFGGTSITGHGYAFYDGPHRAEAAAVLVENYNAPPHLRAVQGRWTDRMVIKLVAEDLPNPENRVVLDASGAAKTIWHGHDDYALRGLYRARDRLQEILPFRIESILAEHRPETEAHIQGTHRMGTDPATSVVDPALRVHGLSNVLALGAGCFPTCSPANPTLTLSALSLMAGRLC